jgi:hypothetical protein
VITVKTLLRKTAALAAAILLTAPLLAPPPLQAGTLSTDILGMFPKDVGEFAYADMKAARSLPWFRQLRDQMLPGRFKMFEDFLTSAGIDPNTQVDELAWGSVKATKDHGEEIVGVALGQFNPSAAEERFKQQKLPSKTVRGYKLYAFGSGAGPNDIFFFFLDSNTAAFGMGSVLEKLIEIRFGAGESLLRNDQLFSLISEANGQGTIWAVLDQSYTRLAMQQLLPQANQFPQAAQLIGRIKAMMINVHASSGVEARFSAVCGSPDDANLLAALLQAGVTYRRYQESQTNPDLAQALDSVTVTPSGDRLQVRIPVSDEQMAALLRNKTFSVPSN